MAEVAEFAIYFAVAGVMLSLTWGFFVVTWRAKEMIVKFLESARADRVWKKARDVIVPDLLVRIGKLEAKVCGELTLVGPRLAAALPQAPDFGPMEAKLNAMENRLETFSRLEDEILTAVEELKQVKGMLMSNLTKMRHGTEKFEEIELQAARAAAAELGIEASEVEPELLKRAKWAKLASRLNPDDPSLSTVEAMGVVLAKEALERADKDGGFAGLLKGRGGQSAAKRPTSSSGGSVYY